MGISTAIEAAATYAGSISSTTYIGAASLAATAAGAAAQAAAQRQAATYQAAVAQNNAKLAEANAKYTEGVGDTKVAAKQEQTSQMLGAERAGLAASGIELDSGSALRLQEDTTRLGAIDAGTIRANAARDAYGFRTQGVNFAAARSQDEAAGNLDAFSSIISGASSVSAKWNAYKQNGTFGSTKSDPYYVNANSNGWT